MFELSGCPYDYRKIKNRSYFQINEVAPLILIPLLLLRIYRDNEREGGEGVR